MNRHPRRVFLASAIGSAASLAAPSAQRLEPAGDSAAPYSKGSRCRILPLPDYQTAVECGGREMLRWHFGAHYPRPFFYPFVGPSGVPLTRMGHPGAPDHDHHRSISEYFGGGRLSDSHGRETEAAIFGQRASWVDYSGPIDDATVEGITYFDHPDNPGFPSKWHVREDGWMGASFCMDEARRLEPGQPLRLRYLLHAHGGGVDAARAARTAEEFARAPWYAVAPSQAKHRQFELQPEDR